MGVPIVANRLGLQSTQLKLTVKEAINKAELIDAKVVELTNTPQKDRMTDISLCVTM